MHLRIPDNAFFTDLFAPGLKLRLDEADDCSIVFQQRTDRRQDELYGDERQIHDREIQRFRDLIARDIAHIRALHGDHARIVAQAPGQLAIADIDGIDLCRAVLQQHIREATGRGTAVDTRQAGWIDRKYLEGFFPI